MQSDGQLGHHKIPKKPLKHYYVNKFEEIRRLDKIKVTQINI